MAEIVSSGFGSKDEVPSSSIKLRIMRHDDIAAGLRLCRASRWNQVARDWELLLDMSPEACKLALDETGAIVGSVAAVTYGTEFGWIAMVLVDPAYRRQGIGTRLLEEGLALLTHLPIVRLDATPAGYPVYLKAGFREEYRLQRMQLGSPRSRPVLDGGLGPPIRRMEAGDIAQVVALDGQAFGSDRRVLLEAFCDRSPEYALVAGKASIDGYLFGRQGHTFEHLGPLVARNEDTARRLVGHCLTKLSNSQVIIDVPSHASWAGWLESIGFTVQRPFIRMYSGQRQHRERRDLIFAIAGAEFA